MTVGEVIPTRARHGLATLRLQVVIGARTTEVPRGVRKFQESYVTPLRA